MDVSSLPTLLGIAVLLPLISFFVLFAAGRYLPQPKYGGYIATGAIVASGLLSFWSLFVWLGHYPVAEETPGTQQEAAQHAGLLTTVSHPPQSDASTREVVTGTLVSETSEGGHAAQPQPITGDYSLLGQKVLGQFGKLRLAVTYYIDALTLVMFCVVTLIASCIHFYSMGYMHEELEEVTDHEVTMPGGEHLHRRGRYPVFFQYMSLFCFSMLGLVLAGNALMVFVFWELVGICSYFLIGFYIERKSASNAANKAFIVNRIGDFGMLIGLMAIWGGLGTLTFGDVDIDKSGSIEQAEMGIFSQVRPENEHHALVTPEGMTADVGNVDQDAKHRHGYWLMIVAGVGIFCGCVGKSAQFPLHVWLPDAMEGPTPVSALVHSATMVAAGVYLVGRFFPFFVPEVLLVIAVTGVITLFMAATIAITATDIKRVLAYSTVSQLGYMMLALGLGGWLAGMMHLVTHAFFKSLLFLCSGSVIHAVHSNEMTDMGGLRKKMPITAATMLIGCLAIAGMAIPFVIGFSGYYSKDKILEQAFVFWGENHSFWGSFFFIAAAGGAAITAFYMFRLWFMTFAGRPRDQHRYDHAHESPRVMTVPLMILAVFAIGVAWKSPFMNTSLQGLLEQARPLGTLATVTGELVPMTWPDEHIAHLAENYRTVVVPVTLLAFLTAVGGIALAMAMYLYGTLNPVEVRRQFPRVYRFLRNKWWFDELYDIVFVKPTLLISRVVAGIDTRWIDWLIDSLAAWTAGFARFWEWLSDKKIIDAFVDFLAARTYRIGLSLRQVQTGRLRQYVLFLAVGLIAVFLIVSFFWSPTFAR